MPDTTRSTATAVLIPLPELGVISVSGPDAVSFLQSQLTNDVARLRSDRMQLSGYCTPKGRLLATFHQWRDGETVWLRTPRDVVASIVKRLSMFVLRAKAKITDVSDQWATYALVGSDAALSLADANVAVPPTPYDSSFDGKVRVDRVLPTPAGLQRFLLTVPGDAPPPVSAQMTHASARWWLTEIEAAIPTVFAATQERFVPQMLNFEVLGGVDFKKGCYPGQEVVARSQYLGKLKRRMHAAHVDAVDVQPASDVYAADGAQPVGTVVMAAPSTTNGSELLFEAPLDRVEAGSLHLLNPGGPELVMRPLPYTLFDPTQASAS